MRHADQQHGTPAVAHAQELDRLALGREPRGLEARLTRKFVDQRARPLAERPEPQELLVLRDAREDVPDV
jgi:hypothetical protein